MHLIKVILHDKLSENVSCEILSQGAIYNDKVITLSDKHSLLQNIQSLATITVWKTFMTKMKCNGITKDDDTNDIVDIFKRNKNATC